MKTIEIITTKELTPTKQELRGLRYKDFENLAKLLLNYETYYYETRKRKITLTLPVKHAKRNSEAKPY